MPSFFLWTVLAAAAPAPGRSALDLRGGQGDAEGVWPTAEVAEPPVASPHPPERLRRTQAFLLPRDAAARDAAVRVAAGVTEAMLHSPGDAMVDLSAALAAGGPRGVASLSPLVAAAAAEAEAGGAGPELRRLAARFSLDRILVGSVAVRGRAAAVLLAWADAPGGRLLGTAALSVPLDGALEVQVQAALRDLFARAQAASATPTDPAASDSTPADVPATGAPPPTDAARTVWKRGLFDKTGTESWDLPGTR
ncbi:MAG: hypothetical protein NVS4B10_02770 [Myxococcales bacterium]